ncbi:MAG TPA: 6-phosphogluconolactonase, partial [Gammaproteobacteria bacterium]
MDINTADWQVYDSEALLVCAVTDLIEARLRQAISEKGEFHLVFPGGRSIVAVLKALSKRTVNWQGVHLYLTDERCVVRGDNERNDRLVDEFLLASIVTDPPVLHRIPAE